MLLMNVAFRLRAGIRHDPQTGAFVAYCPALDIYSAGQDLASARRAIRGAAKLFLEACWERGQFETIMRRRDFRPSNDQTRLDEAHDAEFLAIQQADFPTIVDLDVPLSLIGSDHPDDETCRP
jgi:predicted RNase H-like HicB family nuclease